MQSHLNLVQVKIKSVLPNISSWLLIIYCQKIFSPIKKRLGVLPCFHPRRFLNLLLTHKSNLSPFSENGKYPRQQF
ncbi:MAG: hypothetical protein AN486_12640 [Anabaena sp. AL93]|jgi:hypothetical protein|nr:MAG: hypothetical protein AN486_12640 [Anabaena sp. AL93]